LKIVPPTPTKDEEPKSEKEVLQQVSIFPKYITDFNFDDENIFDDGKLERDESACVADKFKATANGEIFIEFKNEIRLNLG